MRPKHKSWRPIDIIYGTKNDSTWENRAAQSALSTCGNVGASYRTDGCWNEVDLLPVLGLWSFKVPVSWCSYLFVRNRRSNELPVMKSIRVHSGLSFHDWIRVPTPALLSRTLATSSFFVLHHSLSHQDKKKTVTNKLSPNAFEYACHVRHEHKLTSIQAKGKCKPWACCIGSLDEERTFSPHCPVCSSHVTSGNENFKLIFETEAN